MNILSNIIKTLSPAKINEFKSGYKRVTLDLRLFNLIIANSEADDKQHMVDLGLKDNRNEYYQVKNILKRKLEEFLTTQTVENNFSKRAKIMELLSLSEYFNSKNITKAALYYLNLAEKKAQDMRDYEVLNIVYSYKVDKSYKFNDVRVEDAIEAYENNKQSQEELFTWSVEYAKITDTIISSQYFEGVGDRAKALEQTMKTSELLKNEEFANSFNVQYKLMEVVYNLMRGQNQTELLIEYLIARHEEWTEKGFFSKNTHDKLLGLLMRLVILNFMETNFEQCLKYSNILGEQMKMYEGHFYDKYNTYYCITASNLFWATNQLDKAINTLESYNNKEYLNTRKIELSIFNTSLAKFYYYNGNHSKASDLVLDVLNDVEMKPMLDKKTVVFIKTFEILANFEDGADNYIDYLIKALKRRIIDLQKVYEFKEDKDLLRLKDFLKLVHKIHKDKSVAQSAKFKKEANKFIAKGPTLKMSTLEYVSFNIWLKNKTESVDVYKQFLKEIEENAKQHAEAISA